MSALELNNFTKELIVQQEQLEKNLMELAVYGNGSVTYKDLLQMSVGNVKRLSSIISKKIKQDKGITESNML
jgi:hypothetical protein|tara:strand:- start:5881 stop:6096 length:216 start_codon:yes stop_codon:yes gene_type:complete